jgi:hypothetical protein
MQRLIRILEQHGLADEFCIAQGKRIGEGKLLMMQNQASFVSFLDDLVDQFSARIDSAS